MFGYIYQKINYDIIDMFWYYLLKSLLDVQLRKKDINSYILLYPIYPYYFILFIFQYKSTKDIYIYIYIYIMIILF